MPFEPRFPSKAKSLPNEPTFEGVSFGSIAVPLLGQDALGNGVSLSYADDSAPDLAIHSTPTSSNSFTFMKF